MNAKLIAKTTSITLIVSVLVLFLIPTGFAAKGGNGGGKPGGGGEDPPAVTTCADKASAFPAFAYMKAIKNKRGQTVGTDMYLSNFDGDCSVLIYSYSSRAEIIDLSYRQFGDQGVIVWNQMRDENTGKRDSNYQHDVIKMIRFQVLGKEVTSLPSTSDVIVSSGGDGIGFTSVDLSHDGNRVLFSVEDGEALSNMTVSSLREVDISSCSPNCIQSVLISSTNGVIRGASYGPIGNRVYYSSRFRGLSEAYVAFIENQNGVWSSPRLVTSEHNGNYSSLVSFHHPDVALADIGNGQTELIAFHYYDGIYEENIVQIIDIGNCAVNGLSDCVSTGESFIVQNIIDHAESASFDRVIDATSLMYLNWATNAIMKINFSDEEGALLIENAYRVDSAQ